MIGDRGEEGRYEVIWGQFTIGLVLALFFVALPTSLFLGPYPVGVIRPDHLVDSALARHEAVDPMQIREPNPQAAPRLRIFDAERDDDFVALAGDRNLT